MNNTFERVRGACFAKYNTALILATLLTLTAMNVADAEGTAEIQVFCDQPTVELSPHLYGLFFEDINYAADGGLYAELVQNRSFEYYSLTNNRRGQGLHPLYAWNTIQRSGGHAETQVTDAEPLNPNNRNYVELQITKSGEVGVSNKGYDGIHLDQGARYNVSLYARAKDWSGDSSLTIRLESKDGSDCGSVRLQGVDGDWKKLEGIITANQSTDEASLLVTTSGEGTLHLDMVSLFPQNTFKGRRNGLRKDLVLALKELNPKFFRFPGGCIAHGSGYDNRYNWKDSVGDIAQRKPNWNLWGYHQSYGLGFFEYFQLCEDLEMAPLPVIPIGVGCGFRGNDFVPIDELGPHIQDALDLIEFANGPTTSLWGQLRAEMGHPKPFNLEFVCLGNEEHDTPDMRQRFPLFSKAIREAYPEIKIIGTSGLGAGIPIYDLMTKDNVYSSDEHYYMPPNWFLKNEGRFDDFDRNKPLIFVGEYAAHDHGRKNTLFSAISEAVFLNGVERNADMVDMTCYAPLFGRKGHCQWNPDLIYFDKRNVVRTANYYVQQLYGQNKGDVFLNNEVAMKTIGRPSTVSGQIGIGSWNTTIEVEKVTVNGRDVSPTNWKVLSGTYSDKDNHYYQTDKTATPAMSLGREVIDGETVSIEIRARKTGGSEGFLVRFGADAKGNGGYWWNVGGWNNTRHGLEELSGRAATVDSVGGSIETNRWYDLTVELSPGQIRCYIDDQLIQQYEIKPAELSLSSTYDQSTGEVILKMANPTADSIQTHVNLAGAQQVANTATLISLSGTKDATNTYENPENIVPSKSSIPAGKQFSHTISAYTVDVIRLKTER
ncbi:alpha-L-arabinofuranosidase C-terminal domain-containing protein [Rhodopirellula sallentina]|uniref:non-reducing end alpha-L-arabinofuranosidase n=1 Tax=Rhodopirellula sallentina SM41 TaxID=1263870 RepID=M5UML8_9BACT|nr:alpha-L-arabinofuranosidase C-terminal domain-containing protein [Rhodopirellula sallentina]EMI57233.1 secreted arabinosidase [Rhodopirellula sallentina SM41]